MTAVYAVGDKTGERCAATLRINGGRGMIEPWKTMDSAPNDGRAILLFARLNIQGSKPEIMVGFWSVHVFAWRPMPDVLNTKGLDLVANDGTELPKLPA